MNCEFCKSPVHVWFQCPKKPDGWKPVRLANGSTASRKDEDSMRSDKVSEGRGKAGAQVASIVHVAEPAGTQALPVDTNPGATNEGLHIASSASPSTSLAGAEGDKTGTKFDKKAYMRLYMAEYRKGKRRRAADA